MPKVLTEVFRKKRLISCVVRRDKHRIWFKLEEEEKEEERQTKKLSETVRNTSERRNEDRHEADVEKRMIKEQGGEKKDVEEDKQK